MIKRAMLRGGIPFVIMGLIALILNIQGQPENAWSTFLVSVILLIVGAATVIYEIERISFLLQSFIHFFIMLITIYPILLISGWFEVSNLFGALTVLLLFVGVGIMLWTILLTMFSIFKKQ